MLVVVSDSMPWQVLVSYIAKKVIIFFFLFHCPDGRLGYIQPLPVWVVQHHHAVRVPQAWKGKKELI